MDEITINLIIALVAAFIGAIIGSFITIWDALESRVRTVNSLEKSFYIEIELIRQEFANNTKYLSSSYKDKMSLQYGGIPPLSIDYLKALSVELASHYKLQNFPLRQLMYRLESVSKLLASKTQEREEHIKKHSGGSSSNC